MPKLFCTRSLGSIVGYFSAGRGLPNFSLSMNPDFLISSRILPYIAIVDDDPSVLKAIRRLLGSCGFCTETFASGRIFLDALHGHSPDCVLLDLHMLGLTGWEVQAEMAAVGYSIPVIFITGDSDPAVWDKAIAAGATALLRKPFSECQLLEAIALAITPILI